MTQFDTSRLTPGLLTDNPDAQGPAPQMQRVLKDPKPADKHGWWWGTGRRKTAVARVRIRPARSSKASKDAKGVHGGGPGMQVQLTRKSFKPIDVYFCEIRDRRNALAPLELTDTADKLEVFVRVHGGGFMAQAEAVRLGVSRALVGYDPTFETPLREAGFLTRDDRKVERKKYGLAGARRRFQFSKR